MRVFVIDQNKQALAPCSEARANRLLDAKKAAVYRLQPFTIILQYAIELDAQPKFEMKLDPGSKTTGLALVGIFPKQGHVLLWAGELTHRGEQIKAALLDRRARRRTRRTLKTRYRPARFDNRPKPAGWLPPSVMSRVNNITTWVKLLQSRCVNVAEICVEHVKFDMQLMENPEIQGQEYQRGSLYECERRQFVLTRGHHTCAYCGAQSVPLEQDHVQPKSKGGSNRPSNFVPACHPCNQAKSNQSVEEFLARKPEVLRHIKAQLKTPLKDAAAVNAMRWRLCEELKKLAPVSLWSGGRTKWNRTNQGYEKGHWIDAACVGTSGEQVNLNGVQPSRINALGRGTRHVQRCDTYGFPRGQAGRIKRIHGFSTGDYVKLRMPKGKYAGEHIGVLAGIRSTGILDIKTTTGDKIGASYKHYRLQQRAFGYRCAHAGKEGLV